MSCSMLLGVVTAKNWNRSGPMLLKPYTTQMFELDVLIVPVSPKYNNILKYRDIQR